MTAKDFIKIANVLAAQFAVATPDAKGPIWCLTLSMADMCAQDNPNFNRSLFYATVFGTADHFAARDSFTRDRLWGATA